MKRFKKILKITVISVLVIIALLVASTFIFKDKIVDLVKVEINKTLEADVDFKKVDISFFRHFPRVSIGLDELQIIGKPPFQADTLLYAKRFDAAVNIMSFFRGKDMNIYSVSVNSPRIHALVNKDGLANWNIVKEDSTEAQKESKPFHLELKKYEIKNAYIFYDDKPGNISAEVVNLNHKGSGDFSSDLFTLITSTTADQVTYTYGGVPFLYKVKTNLDADLTIDNREDKYSFENLAASLNAMKITASGFLKMLEDGYDMDIQFKSPDTEFKNILSLIPVVYKKDFDKVTASGQAAFEGNVKGVYSEKTMPGYHVSMVIKNGAFKYPDLPKGIEQINLNAVVDNPDGETDNTVVNISNANLKIDKDPFSFRLLMKHPVTSMFVDAAAKGKLDLTQVSQFIKLEKGTQLSGLLNADLSVKGNVNDLEKQQYQNFFAAGNLDLSSFKYVSSDYPDGVFINTLNTSFTPSRVNISNLTGEYLKTKFSGNGQINNLMNYVFSNKPLSANINVNADKIDLNKWMGLASDTTTQSDSGPFVVPANLNVVLNARAGEIDYDKINIRNLAGALTIDDETVKLNDIHGDAFDGTISIGGSYSTKLNKKKPSIALTYQVNKVDIQKTFMAVNTVQKLMPIGRFLSGSLSSSLNLHGNLDNDMEVDMSTLSGAGNLLLIEGVLSKFAPLEKIASTLNVAQLHNITMKDIKAFFEFSNGKLLVKPFTVKVHGIEMEIGGLQAFDESIDYAVNMKLPRALLGTQGNQLINNLASAASSKGIPVNVGDVINLKLDLGGTIKNPTIKTDLKQTGESLAAQMEEQVKEFAQAKIDSAKSAAVDTLQSIKKQVTEAAKDELKKALLGGKDTDSTAEPESPKNVADKAKESAKGLLKNILKKEKDTTKKEN